MKACNGLCKCLAVGVIAFGVNAFGQEFSWVPVDASVGFATGGAVDSVGEDTEMIVTAQAGAFIVEWEIRLNGWAAAGQALGAVQAGVNADGFLGANASPANAGVDLSVLSGVAWQENQSVSHGGLFDGAHIITNTCEDLIAGNIDLGIPCGSIPGTHTWGGCGINPGTGNPTFCTPNPEFVFSTNLAVGSVATAVANIVWGGVSTAGVCTVDDGSSYYLGTLILDVPGGAVGSYTFGFDPSQSTTFMNDCGGGQIPGAGKVSGTLTMETGACCSILAGTGVCTENVLEEDCLIPPNTRWSGGLTCADAIAAFGPCPSCTTHAQCDDGNACTDDSCNFATNICENPDNFDPVTQCCETTTGNQTTIDDGDVCTFDSCILGVADHNPAGAIGVSCDDSVARTCPDVCDGVNSQANGGCFGDEITTIACPNGDSDCCIGFCDPATGFCELIEDPSLCFDWVFQNNGKDDNCYVEGETVWGVVSIGGSSQTITGGQFLMNYDPSCIEVLSVDTCGGIYNNVIASSVDPAAGTIFFAVTVDPAIGLGSNQDEDVVCISFKKLGDCGTCDVCFDSVNPYNTRLVNADGNAVGLDPVCGDCSKLIELAGNIDLDVPDGADVNSECDLPTAIVTWNAPNGFDDCDGPLTLTCNAEHDGGVPIAHLLNGGGEFPQGTSFFECHVENNCGNEGKKVWTVKVSDQQSLDIYVQLEPSVDPGLFSRCICFELYDDCVSDPTEYCDVLWFGGPYNFDGKTRTKVKVDKGQYHCITARDTHHSLRSTADILCIDGQYTAEFRGDPLLDGNWLVAGNLDYCKAGGGGSPDTIDILDFGMFMNEIANGAMYANGSTDCNTPCPHADINGDGLVDNGDYAFILNNYLKASKDSCCPGSDFIAPPVESITVKELRALGMGELAVADLNRDGVLDAGDMADYMSGVEPVAIESARKATKAEGFRGR